MEFSIQRSPTRRIKKLTLKLSSVIGFEQFCLSNWPDLLHSSLLFIIRIIARFNIKITRDKEDLSKKKILV